MKAMLEPRIVAARIHGSDFFGQGAAAALGIRFVIAGLGHDGADLTTIR